MAYYVDDFDRTSALQMTASIPYDAKYYEEKVNSSPLFELDANENPDLYEAEYTKLMYNLTNYLYKYDCRNTQFSYEIIETFDRCLKSFKPDAGQFLNYFNHSWSVEKGRVYSKRNIEEFTHGMKIDGVDVQNIHDYFEYIRLSGDYIKELTEKEIIEDIADTFKCGIEKARTIYEIRGLSVKGECEFNTDDGDEGFNVIENIPDRGNKFDEEYELCLIRDAKRLQTFCDYYNSKNANQRKYFGMIVTVMCCEGLPKEEDDADYPDLVALLKKQPFFSEYVFDYFIKNGKVPADNEIAVQVNMLPSAISRGKKDLLDAFLIKHKFEN